MHPDLEKLATLIEEAEQHNDYERARVERLARDNAPAEMLARSEAIREVRMRIQDLTLSKSNNGAPDQTFSDQDRVVYDPATRELIDLLASSEASADEDELVPISDDEIDALRKKIDLVEEFPQRFRGYFWERLIGDKLIHASTTSKSISDRQWLDCDDQNEIDSMIVHLHDRPDILADFSVERILKARAVKILMDHGMYVFEERYPGMHIRGHWLSEKSTPGVDLTPLLREVFHELIKQGRYNEAFLVYRSYEHEYQPLREDEIIKQSIATMSEKDREGLTLACFRFHDVEEGDDDYDFLALHPLLECERRSLEVLKSDEDDEIERCKNSGREFRPQSFSVHWSKEIRGWIRGSLDVAPTTS